MHLDWLSFLAPVSTWLIMFNLGLKTPHTPQRLLTFHAMRFWWAHYLFPLAFVLIAHGLGGIGQGAAAGLSVCILAGVGTSSVPFALGVKANPEAVSARLVVSSVVALVAIPLLTFTLFEIKEAVQQAGLVVLVFVFAVLLPWLWGQATGRKQSLSPKLEKWIEKAGNWSVIALIVGVAFRELPKLPNHPELVWAGLGLAVVLALGGVYAEGKKGLAITALIRNLTLTILVLNTLKVSSEAFTAMSVFGAVMYLVSWPLHQWSKRLMAV